MFNLKNSTIIYKHRLYWTSLFTSIKSRPTNFIFKIPLIFTKTASIVIQSIRYCKSPASGADHFLTRNLAIGNRSRVSNSRKIITGEKNMGQGYWSLMAVAASINFTGDSFSRRGTFVTPWLLAVRPIWQKLRNFYTNLYSTSKPHWIFEKVFKLEWWATIRWKSMMLCYMPFQYNIGTWQTDGRTALLYQYRAR